MLFVPFPRVIVVVESIPVLEKLQFLTSDNSQSQFSKLHASKVDPWMLVNWISQFTKLHPANSHPSISEAKNTQPSKVTREKVVRERREPEIIFPLRIQSLRASH